MKQAFSTIKPTLYDPTQSDYTTNPFTPAGTFKTFQGIDPQGNPTAIHSLEPNSFTANTLGQKALDAIKSDTGININAQWQPPFAAGLRGYYDRHDPSNTQDSRTINFTSDQPDINVLLHEAGHAVDPSLSSRSQQGTAKEFQSLSPGADQLNYIWNHGGQDHLQAETEAQRFARGYAYQLSPALGHAMTSDPWFKGYPKSYGENTITDYFESQLPSPKNAFFTTPNASNPFDATTASDSYGMDTTNTRWGADPRKALGMALDPKFQQAQQNILKQANDYVDNTLR